MAKAEHYNQYPEGFLEKFDKPVTFKLIDIKPDPDNEGGWLMPVITSVPPESRVSFTDKHGDTHLVRLALISNIDTEGNIRFDDRRLFIGQINNGEIRLDPSRSRDIEVWRYLHHCGWNRSSPYAEEDGKHIIYEYDWEEEAKEEIGKRSSMLHAFKFIASASDSEIRKIYVRVGQHSARGIGINGMKNELEEMAMTDPQKLSFAISEIEEEKPKAAPKNVEIPEDKPIKKQELDPEVVENIEGDREFSEDLVHEAKNLKVVRQMNPRNEFLEPDGQAFFKWNKKSDTEERTPVEQLIDAVHQSKELRDRLKYLVKAEKSRD